MLIPVRHRLSSSLSTLCTASHREIFALSLALIFCRVYQSSHICNFSSINSCLLTHCFVQRHKRNIVCCAKTVMNLQCLLRKWRKICKDIKWPFRRNVLLRSSDILIAFGQVLSPYHFNVIFQTLCIFLKSSPSFCFCFLPYQVGSTIT